MSKEHWGEGGVYLRGATWWIHYPTGGRTIRESSKSADEKAARKLLRKRLAEIQSQRFAGPAIERVMVTELLDDLLTDYEINRKTLWWAKLNVNVHLRPFFKYFKAVKIGTKQIQAYVLKKRADGLADSTINRHLALLRRAFKLGAKADPRKVLHVPFIEKYDESAGVRHGFFEHADYLKLRDELPGDVRPIAVFAYYTGCRKGEILGLRWPQVDLESRMVKLRSGETKNKEPRTIPMATELCDAIAQLKAERDEFWKWSDWVFSRQGKQIKSFYGAWRSACKRAGLEDADKLLHDMRRSGVRNLVRAGVPEKIAMKISGHKTRSIFDRYDISSEADFRNAAELLDKHLKGKK